VSVYDFEIIVEFLPGCRWHRVHPERTAGFVVEGGHVHTGMHLGVGRQTYEKFISKAYGVMQDFPRRLLGEEKEKRLEQWDLGRAYLKRVPLRPLSE
jgi:hypothetical protein